MLKRSLPHAKAAHHDKPATMIAKFQHGERVMVKWSKPSADGHRLPACLQLCLQLCVGMLGLCRVCVCACIAGWPGRGTLLSRTHSIIFACAFHC